MAVNVLDYVGIGIDPKTGKKHAINYLPKVAEWEETIYQYEMKDKLIGGVDGLDNVQAQMLANRTEYLKKAIEEKGGAGIEVCTISIPKTGWTKGTGIYEYTIDIPSESITENLIPILTILPTSVDEAASCGLCPACETVNGALRLYAKKEPQTAMEGSLTLIFPKGGGGNVDLPIATESALGAVKIGNGLTVQSDGTLSINKDTVMTNEDLVDEEEAKADLAEILKNRSGE